MGMDAEILVIAPFHKDFSKDLYSYDEDYYRGIPEGTRIPVLALTASTTTASQELAELFGIDPWDFTQHIIKEPKPNWDPSLLKHDEIREHLPKLRKILERDRCTIIYLPNG